MKRVIMLAVVLLSACSPPLQQPFFPQKPAASGQALPPAQTATPIACTTSEVGQLGLKHLPDFDQKTTTAVAIELQQLRAGERLMLIFDAGTAAQRQTIEFQPVEPVGEDGRFSYVEHLSTLPGTNSTEWTVKVVHAQGVLCDTVTVPMVAQP